MWSGLALHDLQRVVRSNWCGLELIAEAQQLEYGLVPEKVGKIPFQSMHWFIIILPIKIAVSWGYTIHIFRHLYGFARRKSAWFHKSVWGHRCSTGERQEAPTVVVDVAYVILHLNWCTCSWYFIIESFGNTKCVQGLWLSRWLNVQDARTCCRRPEPGLGCLLLDALNLRTANECVVGTFCFPWWSVRFAIFARCFV